MVRAGTKTMVTPLITPGRLSGKVTRRTVSYTHLNQEQILEKLEQINQSQADLSREQLSAQQSYDSAVLNGSLAGDIYGYTVDDLAGTVEEAQAAVEEAQSLLDDFEAFVGTDGIVYADGSGLITEVAYESGDRLMNTGAMLSYVKEEDYTITIDVSEEDISYINVGDTVDIDVYKRQTYDWENDAALMTPLSETILYLVHPRGFTRHASSGVEHKGTFAAVLSLIHI